MAILFGLENPTFFWPKVTFEFLNVPRGGPPVKEIFLKNTIVFSASLMQRQRPGQKDDSLSENDNGQPSLSLLCTEQQNCTLLVFPVFFS